VDVVDVRDSVGAMGVKGLKTYIEDKSKVLRDIQFRNSKLVIDGSNLYYTLYFGCKLDQAHGGEYEAFETLLGRFFTNLKICKVQPYVVLDGGDDISDKKFQTLKNRAGDRIKRADSLSRGQRGEVLPILIKNVFKQVLRKLQVPLIQCVAEADWEVAALANEWNCPVLSNDSDFYIFDIRGGFLPLSYFQWSQVRPGKFILAKRYSVGNLCDTFNGMSWSLLPIFATILGNDYANLDKSLFPNWEEFSPQHSHIDGLLRWLSRSSGPIEAIAALRKPIRNPKKSFLVLKVLTEGLEEYSLTSSSIAQFFTTGEPQGRLPGPLQSLPEWFLKGVAEGKLNSILLDVITLHRVTLNVSVQDCSLASSNLTSRPIRQVFYGLMQQRSQAGPESEPYEVEEYDREGLQLVSSKVPPVLPNLQLDTLWTTPQNERLRVFLNALRMSQALDKLIPPSLQLAVYVTCYWLNHAQPEPKPEFFWALLVGLVCGELSRDPSRADGASAGPVDPAHLEAAVAGVPDGPLNARLVINLATGQARRGPQPGRGIPGKPLPCVWESGIALVVGVLPQRLKNLKRGKEKSPPDLQAAHAYSQWQCTLRDSICLNQLLANPVPEPEYTRLYSGVLVHRAAREMSTGVAPESLLGGGPGALELYRTLRNAVERELDVDVGRRMRVQPKQAQPSVSPEHREPVDEMTAKFWDLMDGDEDEDPRRGKKGKAVSRDEDIYEQKCWTPTRQKVRNKSKYPKAKKYEYSL
ncbi:hypothetical protein NFI96_014821, partial [Prochilodus magdalenae]